MMEKDRLRLRSKWAPRMQSPQREEVEEVLAAGEKAGFPVPDVQRQMYEMAIDGEEEVMCLPQCPPLQPFGEVAPGEHPGEEADAIEVMNHHVAF